VSDPVTVSCAKAILKVDSATEVGEVEVGAHQEAAVPQGVVAAAEREVVLREARRS